MTMGGLAIRHVRDVMTLRAAGLFDPGDRAAGRGGALDCAIDDPAVRSRGTGLAACGRHYGCGSGEAAVCRGRPKPGQRRRAEPDWAAIHRERKR